MTSYSVPEDQALADALTEAVAVLERQGRPEAAYVAELRNMATPGNGWPGPAAMPWAVRSQVAQALRHVAEGHPLGDQLAGIASGLDASVMERHLNGGGPRPTSWL